MWLGKGYKCVCYDCEQAISGKEKWHGMKRETLEEMVVI
jgi:hypothetical protein